MPSDARIDDWIRSLGHRGFLPSYWNGYDTEVTQSKHLKLARVGGESLRAVMANVPCYMLFDDHEVTDDWNLDGTWHRKVFRSPVGKRIVSNALLAYWAFQGWGNDPDAFAPNWVQELRDYAALQSARRGTATTAQAQRYEELLWNHEGWGFVAPTTPPCILVDTRTQRDFNLGKWRAPRLLNAQALKEFKRQVRQVVRDPSAPLVLVLPCPFIGHLLSDQYRQTRLLRNRGTSGVDYELWRDNGRGWLDLLDALVELGLERVIVLSGDVHFGCQVMSSIARRKGKVIHNLKVLELTSSAIKNENVNTRTNIAYLQRKYHRSRVGAAIVDIHDLITGPNASRYPDPLDSDFDRGKIEGWERPSGLAFKRGTNAGDRLIQDAIFQGYGGANAYMAREVVLLGEGLAGYLGVPDPPDWIEDVKYPGPAAVVGTNNVGWLRILSGEVHHVLKTRSGSGYLVEERW